MLTIFFFLPFNLFIDAISGMFFNCLNAFWMTKIVKKIIRKFSGSENWKSKNHVKDI